MNWIAVCTSNLKFFWALAALVALSILTVTVVSHASLNPAQKHMSEQACSSCHLAGDATSKENAHQLVASQERLCAGACHSNAVQVSHPSGIRPTFMVPPAYPVDWKGDMTCSTCHNVHGNNPGLLRGSARGRGFCMSCHDRGFFDKMIDQGASMISSGHNSSMSAKVDLASLDVDPYTVQCMSCHANSANLSGTTIDSQQILRHSGKSVSHPIGRHYSEYARKGNNYKPESVVAQRLLLPDGRLSCVSCHQGYTKEHGKLRVGMRVSALCFECHNL